MFQKSVLEWVLRVEEFIRVWLSVFRVSGVGFNGV